MNVYRSSLRFGAILLLKFFLILLSTNVVLDLIFFLEIRITLKDFQEIIIYTIPVFLCLVLVTCIFYAKVSETGLTSFNSYAIKPRTAEWNEIKSASVRNLVLFKLIKLYDESGKELVTLPYKGLTRYDDFIEKVSRYAGTDHPLTQFLNAQKKTA